MTTKDEDLNGMNLAERIRRLANGRTTLDVAQFQFIGLTDIRARYGERWPEKRERVQTIAGDFISKRLAYEDVMIPGADGFLVVFGAAAGVLADAAANRISKELNEHFIGSKAEDIDVRFEARRASMSVDDLAQAFGDMIVQSNAAAPAATKPAASRDDLSTVKYVAQPVWDARREAITTYYLRPIDRMTGEELDHFRLEIGGPKSHTDMDELALKASEEAIRALFASGRKAFVGVSLHVSSLNNQTCLTKLFSAMSKFDKALMRYRIIRVAGIEPGFPRIYLEDIARTLKARIPNIAIAVNWQEPDIASVLRLQPYSVGFALGPAVLNAHGPRAELFARVHAAAELAKSHDTPMFVAGDIPPDLAARFVAEGVSLISSPLIWPQLPQLEAAQRWPASRLAQPQVA